MSWYNRVCWTSDGPKSTTKLYTPFCCLVHYYSCVGGLGSTLIVSFTYLFWWHCCWLCANYRYLYLWALCCGFDCELSVFIVAMLIQPLHFLCAPKVSVQWFVFCALNMYKGQKSVRCFQHDMETVFSEVDCEQMD